MLFVFQVDRVTKSYFVKLTDEMSGSDENFSPPFCFSFKKGEAIDVVSYEVIKGMVAQGHQIFVQILIRDMRSEVTFAREELAKKMALELPNIKFLPTIYLTELPDFCASLEGGVINRLILFFRCLPGFRNILNIQLFPAMAAAPIVQQRVSDYGVDVVASIWSWEALEASYNVQGVPKFVYYGNPNHKPPKIQLDYPQLFDMPYRGLIARLKLAVLKNINRARELQHLKMMNQCEVTANNALIDAQYYAEHGHKRSIYLQNMWPDPPSPPVFSRISSGRGVVAKYCASVGNLGATGNTFGLHYLGKELLPRVEQRLGPGLVSAKIYGGGNPRAAVAEVLNHPSVCKMGWVDDINSEIVASHAFLVLTNAYGFNVGNTRILLAWSLGACVIAHSSSALSMPELEHGKNILLGNTPDEIVDLMVRVFCENGLRERIGRGGYETFKKYYRSEEVMPKMLNGITETLSFYKEEMGSKC